MYQGRSHGKRSEVENTLCGNVPRNRQHLLGSRASKVVPVYLMGLTRLSLLTISRASPPSTLVFPTAPVSGVAA